MLQCCSVVIYLSKFSGHTEDTILHFEVAIIVLLIVAVGNKNISRSNFIDKLDKKQKISDFINTRCH